MIFQKCKIARRKSRFLRVGEFAWELNIDSKRLRKKIKNDIEKRTKRDEKKEHQERQKEHQKAVNPFDPATRRQQVGNR